MACALIDHSARHELSEWGPVASYWLTFEMSRQAPWEKPEPPRTDAAIGFPVDGFLDQVERESVRKH
jgi:hypothetical protein